MFVSKTKQHLFAHDQHMINTIQKETLHLPNPLHPTPDNFENHLYITTHERFGSGRRNWNAIKNSVSTRRAFRPNRFRKQPRVAIVVAVVVVYDTLDHTNYNSIVSSASDGDGDGAGRHRAGAMRQQDNEIKSRHFECVSVRPFSSTPPTSDGGALPCMACRRRRRRHTRLDLLN